MTLCKIRPENANDYQLVAEEENAVSVAIWGTGSSAAAAVRILELRPTRAFSSEGGGAFLGLEVEPGRNVDLSIDSLFVCSMHYADIINSLKAAAFPMERVRVFHTHAIHPHYLLNEVVNFDAVESSFSEKQYAATVAGDLTLGAAEINDRLEHLATAFRQAPESGLVLEFGVYRGESLLYIQSLTNRTVYGFDSNKGFVGEDWSGLKFHGFEPLPEALLGHTGFIEGWFQDTLPMFLEENTDSIAFVHYDAGELSATKFVLGEIFPRLMSGAVLVFDEMLATDDCDSGSSPEWIAFSEAAAKAKATFEWIGRSGYSASVRILK